MFWILNGFKRGLKVSTCTTSYWHPRLKLINEFRNQTGSYNPWYTYYTPPPPNIGSTGLQALTLIPPSVYQINCPNVSASLSSYLLITTAFFYRQSNKALLGTYLLPNILWLWKRLHDRHTCIMHSDHHHKLTISQGQASQGIKLLEAPSCLH